VLAVLWELYRVLLLISSFKTGIDPAVVEGICRHESGDGRRLVNKNKNGTWDVGYCQNNMPATRYRPRIPSTSESIALAVKELSYWKKQHNRFCVKMVQRWGSCGFIKYGQWWGIKNCRRAHPWWAHYNWGFRVLRNNYDKKVQCRINNNFKWCKRSQWKIIKFRRVKYLGRKYRRK
jgi:hypothetical protein